MVSHRDSNSDAATEQSTSYFNASFFPESNAYLSDDILNTNYDFKSHFAQGDVSSFQTPQSYDNLRKKTEAEKNNATQALILGSTSAQYQPYYPTEEVPITEGLGTDLINWKLLSHGSSSASGTRSHTSDQRTSKTATSKTNTSKNGHTPPTVCETATIVGGGQSEVDMNDDIDLDEVRKQDFTYLPRFNKQKDIIRNVENATQIPETSDQFPSLASTASFFPAWEMKAYPSPPIEDPALNNMGMHFAYDADSTVSKSQTQSSVFTGDRRRASGTAPSINSYSESSIAESSPSEKYFNRQLMPNYPRYLEDDSLTQFSGYSGRLDSMNNGFAPFPISADLQQVLDNALENLIQPAPMAPPMSSHYHSHPHCKRPYSSSPSSSPQQQSKRLKPKKEHVCRTCNEKFTEKTNLTRHIKSRKCTKTGPDRFFCPVHECPRSYEGRSDNLKTHMKRVHRGEWNKLKSFQGDWREKESLKGYLYA